MFARRLFPGRYFAPRYFPEDGATVANEITLTDIPDQAKFKTVSGFGSVPVSGTWSGATPDEFRYRVLLASDLSEVQAFQALPGSIGAGVWAGTMSVPEGPASGLYVVEVESRLAGVTLDTATGSNEWGVGYIILCAGSSSIHLMRTDGTVAAPNTQVSYLRNGVFEVADGVGAGLHAIGDAVQQHFNLPVCVIDAGDGGTYLYTDWEPRGAPYLTAIAQTELTGGAHGVCFIAGVNDAHDFQVVSQASHLGKLQTTRRHFVEDLGPIFYCQGGSQRTAEAEYIGAAFDVQMNRVKGAEILMDDPDNDTYIACLRQDLSMSSDLQHTNAGGSTSTGDRFANAILHHYDPVTHPNYRGPFISSIGSHPDANRCRVFITLRGGTTINPANVVTGGGFTAGQKTGYRAYDELGELEISAVDRLGTPTLNNRLTFTRDHQSTSLPGGVPIVTYQEGGSPGLIYPDSYTDRIRDNLSGLNLPLEYRTLYEDEVIVSATPDGAPGRKSKSARRRNRWVVEVDGQDHLVDSLEEAQALLKQFIKPEPKKKKRKKSKVEWTPDELPRIEYEGIDVTTLKVGKDTVLEAMLDKSRWNALQALMDDLDDEEAMMVL